MELPSLIGHIAELYRIIVKSRQAPDKLAREYLRSKKYLGSNDRRFISENLFGLLRIKSLPEAVFAKYCITNRIESEDLNKNKEFIVSVFGLMTILSVLTDGIRIEKKVYSFESIKNELVKSLQVKADMNEQQAETLIAFFHDELKRYESIDYALDFSEMRFDDAATFYGQQSWIVERLFNSEKFKSHELIVLLKSFQEPSPLTLRVNSNQEKRAEIAEKLKTIDEGIRLTNYSPFGIILSHRVDLNTVQLYKHGIIEVQDEGSQLISIALSPQAGEDILDACAGAGGKSLHIASLMNNRGNIMATDTESVKLNELRVRARRAGLDSITTLNLKALRYSKMKFDRVLVDAPCSGMGTIRRNPMLKWQLSPTLLNKITRKQKLILQDYSDYVKPGGYLVYSTCSILPDENNNIVSEFLTENPDFKPEPLMPAFDLMSIALPGMKREDFEYQLLPHIHRCDGFYFAKMKRKDG